MEIAPVSLVQGEGLLNLSQDYCNLPKGSFRFESISAERGKMSWTWVPVKQTASSISGLHE